MLGAPEGIEQLGGVDFDEAVFGHVTDAVARPAAPGRPPPAGRVGAAHVRLRRDCVDAKEALSFDTDVVIPVALPGLHTGVRLTRREFEAMISPALALTIACLRRALRHAQVESHQLRTALLTGGSSRIPVIGELIRREFRCPVMLDSHAEHTIALGAARVSAVISDPSHAPPPELSDAPPPELSDAPPPELSDAPPPELSDAPPPELSGKRRRPNCRTRRRPNCRTRRRPNCRTRRRPNCRTRRRPNCRTRRRPNCRTRRRPNCRTRRRPNCRTRRRPNCRTRRLRPGNHHCPPRRGLLIAVTVAVVILLIGAGTFFAWPRVISSPSPSGPTSSVIPTPSPGVL